MLPPGFRAKLKIQLVTSDYTVQSLFHENQNKTKKLRCSMVSRRSPLMSIL